MKIPPRVLSTAAALSTAVFTTSLYAQLASFPGAVGYGAVATGGRSGSVYVVTNLNDSGPGSFRDAVSQSNRIVVFAVGGYVNLQTPVSVSSNITILGQTAPGGGIGFMGREVSLSNKTNDIVQYVRFRQGTLDTDSGKSAVNLGATSDMILDHISVEFGQFDNVDAVGAVNFTLSNSLVGDPIGQQFNSHVETGPVTMINNIFSSAHNRSPLVKTNTQFINNVVYNFQAGYTVANTGGVFTQDILNNYFITGPSTTSPSDAFFQMDTNISVFSSGNLLDSNNDGKLNGSTVNPSDVVVLKSPGLPTTSSLPTLPTAAAYNFDVANAGDSLVRDQVDNQVLSDVTSLGTSGHLWTSQSATGLSNSGYGVIAGGTAPVSTANDGIPDSWAITHGLSITDSTGATKKNPVGYDMIEEYADQLADTLANQTWSSPNGEWSQNSTNWSATIPGIYDHALIRGTPTTNGALTITQPGATCFSLSIGGNPGAPGTTGESLSISAGSLLVQDTLTVGDQNTASLTMTGGTITTANLQLGNTLFDTNGNPTTYTGTLNLNGGILQTKQLVLGGGSPGNWTTGGVWNWSGGTLQAAGTLNVNAPATLGPAGAIVDTNGNTGLMSARLSGPGSFTKIGAGSLTLSAANTYTGSTTITAGTLDVTGSLARNGANSIFIAADPTGATKLIRATPSAASYDGIGSSVTSGLLSSATLLAGVNSTNNSAGESVTMQWRLRQSKELPIGQTGGGEISEVLSLFGMANSGATGLGQSDPFALQINFTPLAFAPGVEASASAAGNIHLNTLNTAGQWTNAVTANLLPGQSGNLFTDVQSSYASFAAANAITDANLGKFLGSWGIDPTNNQAWAILDYNAPFSVGVGAIPVPEPTTAALLTAATLLPLTRRPRKQST